MTTKITVIVDNKENTDLQGEWGLSILVEYGGKKILLDAGQTGLFLENMNHHREEDAIDLLFDEAQHMAVDELGREADCVAGHAVEARFEHLALS